MVDVTVTKREVHDAKARKILQMVINLVSDSVEDTWPGGLDWRQLRASNPDAPESLWRIEVAPGLVKAPGGYLVHEPIKLDPLPLLALFDTEDLTALWNAHQLEPYFLVRGRLKYNGLSLEVFIHSNPFDDAEPGVEAHDDGTFSTLKGTLDDDSPSEEVT